MDDSKIIISGGFAGIAQILTGHPFDTVKVRYIEGDHKTILSCLKCIQEEGYKSFYRGVSIFFLTFLDILKFVTSKIKLIKLNQIKLIKLNQFNPNQIY